MVSASILPSTFRRAWFLGLLLLLPLRPIASAAPANPSVESSEWMTLDDLNAWLESLDGDKPEGKNYWDRGHWMTAVEGRWKDGVPQYRVSHSPLPAERRASWWQWYINQDRQSFDSHVHRLADEGYALVQFNSYERPGGGERFQGVWHKLVPLTHAPLLPAGRYRLIEMEGKPVADAPLSLSIEGDRLTGRTPNHEFKGSVRDRFSGELTRTKLTEYPQNRSEQEARLERSFLEHLQYASWKDEGRKLRVIQGGKTVLRLEPDEAKVEADKPAPR
jgi:hypothetical protein